MLNNILPFSAVVLATENSHFFVVKEGDSSQRPLLYIVDVAADILGWGGERDKSWK
jgi:hypothetical protein